MTSRWLPPPDGVILEIPANRLLSGWVAIVVLGSVGAALGMLATPDPQVGLLHVANLVIPVILNGWLTYQTVHNGIAELTRDRWFKLVGRAAANGVWAGLLALVLAPASGQKLALALMQSLWFIATVNQVLLLGFSRAGEEEIDDGTELDD